MSRTFRSRVWRHPALAVTLNLGVLAVFVAAVQHYWGWQRLLAPWRHLGTGVVVLALCGMIASYLLRALRVYLAEPDIPRGQLFASLRLILVSNVFNLLLPMRSGEAGFPILMRRWFGTDVRHAAGTLVWLRLLDLHVLAAVGVVCAASGWLGHDAPILRWALLFAALCVAAPVIGYLLRPQLHARLLLHEGAISRIGIRGLEAIPPRTGGLLRDLALTWMAWAVKLASLGYVLARLTGLSPVLGVLGAIGGDLSTVLPIHAPGGFGTYEAGVLLLLAPAQAPTPRLLAGAVDLHLLVLTTALVAGGIAWVAARPHH